jgi:hypothetical protein
MTDAKSYSIITDRSDNNCEFWNIYISREPSGVLTTLVAFRSLHGEGDGRLMYRVDKARSITIGARLDGHKDPCVEGSDLRQLLNDLESGKRVLLRFGITDSDWRETGTSIRGISAAIARLRKDCGNTSTRDPMKS